MIHIVKKGAPQFKANLHCHSTYSDGMLEPETLKRIYKEHGYSVLAITDHEYVRDHSAMSEEDFLMITGYEVFIRPNDGRFSRYNPELHVNLLAKDPHNVAFVNYNEQYGRYYKDPVERANILKVGSERPREYTPEYINEFVQTAKQYGYLCTHNHPFWSREEWDMVSQYEGFLSMEMCNYGAQMINGLEYNGQLYEHLLRKGKRLFCHSADDNHNKEPLDHPKSDSFGGFTMIMAEELTYPAIIDALEKGEFYSSMGPQIHELYIDGKHVHIETDPVKQIVMNNSGKWAQMIMGDKEHPVTSADFEINEEWPYIRFTVTDFDGRSADTRGIFKDEYEQQLNTKADA